MPFSDSHSRCLCVDPAIEHRSVDHYGTLLSTVTTYERHCSHCHQVLDRFDLTVSRFPWVPDIHSAIDPEECDHSQRFDIDPESVRVELADPRPELGRPMTWWETIMDLVANTVQMANAKCRRCGTTFQVTRSDVSPTHGSELWVPVEN